MSDTPRTDKQERQGFSATLHWVNVDFARKLERALNKSHELNEVLVSDLQDCQIKLDEARPAKALIPESFRLKIVVNPDPNNRGRGDYELAASIDGDWKDRKKLKDSVLEIVSLMDQLDAMDRGDKSGMELL